MTCLLRPRLSIATTPTLTQSQVCARGHACMLTHRKYVDYMKTVKDNVLYLPEDLLNAELIAIWALLLFT